MRRRKRTRALASDHDAKPDILIVDISLTGPDGLDLLKSIRTRDPSLPVLILSMHDESIYAERALRAGANGYIMKQEATERVLVAVRRILNGEGVCQRPRSQSHAAAVHQRIGDRAQFAASPILSDRELEVFRLIGEGHGTRQIAEELHLSVKTVETYQAHIKEKLSLKNGARTGPTRDPVDDSANSTARRTMKSRQNSSLARSCA